jgi:hypothetical protein
MEPFAISYSRIVAFDCPHYFRMKYLVEEKEANDATASLPLLVGKFCHEVIELYIKELLKLEPKISSDMEIFQAKLVEVWNRNLYIPESMFDEIREMLISFAEVHTIDVNTTWDSEVAIALTWELEDLIETVAQEMFQKTPSLLLPADRETAFMQAWRHDKRAWLRAKLDRVDIHPNGFADIWDYKTGFWIPPESKLKKSMQTKIYPFALHCLNKNIKYFRVFFYYTRWNKIVGPLEYTVEEILPVEQELRGFTMRVLDRINRVPREDLVDASKYLENFPALISENCPICNFDCPLVFQGIEVIKDQQTASRVAMELDALKRAYAKKLGQLKAYAQGSTATAAIEIPTGEWGWKVSETWRGLDPEIIAAYCLENGIRMKGILAVDTTKIKDRPDDDEAKLAIRGMAKVVPGTKFTFTASVKEEEGD